MYFLLKILIKWHLFRWINRLKNWLTLEPWCCLEAFCTETKPALPGSNPEECNKMLNRWLSYFAFKERPLSGFTVKEVVKLCNLSVAFLFKSGLDAWLTQLPHSIISSSRRGRNVNSTPVLRRAFHCRIALPTHAVIAGHVQWTSFPAKLNRVECAENEIKWQVRNYCQQIRYSFCILGGALLIFSWC